MALEVIVERQQAAARRGMMRRAERLAGVDLDGMAAPRHFAPVVAAMDHEASGRDRAALALRQRHPIGGRDFLDGERPKLPFAAGLRDQRQQRLALRRRIVMGEDLAAAWSALEQSDRDRSGLRRLFQRADDPLAKRRLGLDARLMDDGCDGAAAFSTKAYALALKACMARELRAERRPRANPTIFAAGARRPYPFG